MSGGLTPAHWGSKFGGLYTNPPRIGPTDGEAAPADEDGEGIAERCTPKEFNRLTREKAHLEQSSREGIVPVELCDRGPLSDG